METENTQQKINPEGNLNQDTPPSNSILNQKGNFLFIIGGVVLMLVIGVGAYYLGINKDRSSTKVNSQQSQVSPTIQASPMPKSTTKLSDLLEKYKDYSTRDGNVYSKGKLITNTAPFADSKLGISFLYPKRLYFKSSLEPVTQYRTNSSLIIGMTNTPNSKYYPEDTMTQKDYIDYNINCRIDPNPGGICGEGIAPWLDVSIAESSDVQEFNKAGEIQDFGKFKGVSTKTVNLDGSYANSYRVLYPYNNKNFILSFISTTNLIESEDYSYAIWLLLNSFQVN